MGHGKPSMRTLDPLCGKIGRERVEAIIHTFYDRLRVHPDLGRHFSQLDPEHEAHIIDFWWAAMGGRIGEHRPFDMIGRHKPLNLDAAAFTQWLELFRHTLDAQLPPELASQWFQMAQAIGANMQRILSGKR
jgi:hemoglobin